MKVFLSWSGDASHKVAIALHEWLPYMIHSIRPFISSGDISKGDRWSDVLAEELKDARYGIICVTPYNLHKPWMNFEAGALTRVIDQSCVTPFLFDIKRASVEGPLQQFQSTEFTKEDVFSLIYSINSKLAQPDQLSQTVLQRNFDHWWAELSKALTGIQATSPNETRAFYSWLRTFEDLDVHHLKYDCSTVWFVTDDLFKYALRDGVRDKVLANIQQVKYRFLIPEPYGTDENDARRELDELRKGHEKELEYRYLPRDTFEKEAASDYVIFDSRACGVRANVFVKLPIAGTAGEFWVETEERAATSFHRRFTQLWGEAIAPGGHATLQLIDTAKGCDLDTSHRDRSLPA